MTSTRQRPQQVTLFEAHRPLRLESGGTLAGIPVAFERYGPPPAPSGANTVFICHALTGDSHVARHDQADAPGWWDTMVGPGRPIDTNRFHVVCANVLGGCAGTLGPAPEDADRSTMDPFPQVTVADMVAVHRRLLAHLGIRRLHAVVGGSLGGMQALEWLLRHPRDARRYGLIATSARHTADNLAFNAIARVAIRSDPKFREGRYPAGDAPHDGLGIARMIGHMTYMSAQSLETKFGRHLSPPTAAPSSAETGVAGGAEDSFAAASAAWGPFSVERYLEHQADKLVARFDANSYLSLTSAMDRFDAFATPCGPVTSAEPDVHVVSFRSDRLFGIDHSHHIIERLAESGVACTHFHEETAEHGHDAFLMEVPGYLDSVAKWLAAPTTPPTHAAIGRTNRSSSGATGQNGHRTSVAADQRARAAGGS